MRNDFIENYADAGYFTSIGPTYTINWRIEEHFQNDTIKITTDEDNTLFFDLATARFDTEEVLHVENNLIADVQEDDFISIPQTQSIPIEISNDILQNEVISEDIAAPISQSQFSPKLIIVAGLVIVIIGVGIFFYMR